MFLWCFLHLSHPFLPTPNLPLSISLFFFSCIFITILKVGHQWGFPCRSVGKESAYNAGDLGSIPGSGRSPGEGNGNPLQYSCLENPMDRGAWQATVHGVARVGHDLATEPSLPLPSYCYYHPHFINEKTWHTQTTNWYHRSYPEVLREKEMATHFSILAWGSQGTEEPGRLQFMGLQETGMT